ncbi:MAG: ABC transporter permease [Rhizobacter sp.]|nr:ABC transporter permease [Ferruginibacter sp.]
MQEEEQVPWKIASHSGWFKWNLGELWQYKGLLNSFVRRDLIANYQQTVLGPLWIFLQPALTTLVYWIIFSKIAKVSTEAIPPLLFYLPGVIVWSYFSDCLNGSMYTFLHNAALFGKIYFPRLIVPLSNIASHSIRMGVQLLFFLLLYYYYYFTSDIVNPNLYVLLLPLLMLLAALFSLGAGLIISVVTAKYRDLDYTLQFLLRLFMFATPVVYPAAIVPPKYEFIFWLNPLTPVIETFRAAFFSHKPIHFDYLFISVVTVFVILCTGLALFKKRELKIMDII